jgi:chlorophyllide a reductase subunit Y
MTLDPSSPGLGDDYSGAGGHEPTEGSGCHGGAEKLRAAAASAGKSEVLDRYARDYPKGPHDQPQSMCPAFGSLRVGLRMRRTATVLSGSACCVYGLTFTSHFYGARRTVGYVPFNSETLVTGKLFEDIREAVFKLADPALYDTIIVTNRCNSCRRRSTAFASSASTCRVSASPPTLKPRTCSPAPC